MKFCVLKSGRQFAERMATTTGMNAKLVKSASTLRMKENAKPLALQGASVLLKDLLAHGVKKHVVVRRMILSVVIVRTESGYVR